ALLSKNAILSRYFVQRLLMHFGNYDENLIKLKVEHNVNQIDFDRLRALRKKLSSPWGKEALHLFEHRLNEIGDLLMDSFQVIQNSRVIQNSSQVNRNITKSEIASSCLIQTIKPERNFKKTDLLEFIIDKIDQPIEALGNALDHYNVGFKFNYETIQSTQKIRSLTVNSNLYFWILKNYGPNSELTQKCFDDIFESRIWVDLNLTPEKEVPDGLTTGAFNSICSIYLEFMNEKVPFKNGYLQYLQLAKNHEIIHPFFEYNLPIIFGINKNPYHFKNLYEVVRPEIKSNKANKRKSNEVNLEQNHNERKNWFKLLEEIYYHKLHTNNSNITENFKESFENFWDMITLEKIPELKYLSDNLNRNNENLSQQVFEGFSKKQKQ
ncbi:5175_t:CDS:2, partial [Funneliformis geosporum]